MVIFSFFASLFLFLSGVRSLETNAYDQLLIVNSWLPQHVFTEDNGFEILTGFARYIGDSNCDSGCLYGGDENPVSVVYSQQYMEDIGNPIPDGVDSIATQKTATIVRAQSAFQLKWNELVIVVGVGQAEPRATETFSVYADYIYDDGDDSYHHVAASIIDDIPLNNGLWIKTMTGNLAVENAVNQLLSTLDNPLVEQLFLSKLESVRIPLAGYTDQKTWFSVMSRIDGNLMLDRPSIATFRVRVLNPYLPFIPVTQAMIPRSNGLNIQMQSQYSVASFDKNDFFCKVQYPLFSFDLNENNWENCLQNNENCNYDFNSANIFETKSIPIISTNRLTFNVKGTNHVLEGSANTQIISINNADTESMLTSININGLTTDSNGNYEVVFSNDCHTNNGHDELCIGVNLDGVTNINIREINIGGDSFPTSKPNMCLGIQAHTGSSDDSENHIHGNSDDTSNEEDSRPNIITMLLDDFGYRDIGLPNAFGQTAEYTTPIISDLAMTGIRLNAHYSWWECSPTRAALLTGQRPSKFGQSGFSIPGTTTNIPAQVPMLQQALGAAGYATHLVGKSHLGYASWSFTPYGKGWDSNFGIFNGQTDHYNRYFCLPWDYLFEGFASSGIDFSIVEPLLTALFPHGVCGYGMFEGNRSYMRKDSHQWSNDLYRDRMLSKINELKDSTKPFYIHYAIETVHTPIQNPPTTYQECADTSGLIWGEGREEYCNMIKRADENLGVIIESLKENGLWENTLIYIASDNGAVSYLYNIVDNFLLYSFGSNKPLRGIKFSAFEGSQRTIGFLNGGYLDRFNGLRGSIKNEPIHVQDFFLSFLHAANIDKTQYESNIDGCDNYDYLFNGGSSCSYEWMSDGRQGSVSQFAVIRQGDYKLVTGATQIPFRSYCDVNVCNFPEAYTQGPDGTDFLYNIALDPLETHNLVLGQDPADLQKVTQLKVRIDELDAEGYVPDPDRPLLEGLLVCMLSNIWHPWFEAYGPIWITPIAPAP